MREKHTSGRDHQRLSDRVERIMHYESLLRALLELLSDEAALDPAARELADALADYYASEAWKGDYAADEAGQLPRDLQRGVLSEDGIYNALEAYRERTERAGAATQFSGCRTERNVPHIKSRNQFRAWLALHASEETECWVEVKRGRPVEPDVFYYLDAVEEALCFGWIDSTQKLIDGKRMQRFSPRKKNSPWTELNKERVRRLERLGLMTSAGRAVLPAMGPRSFRIDPELEAALKAARCWARFRRFPPLYQRVRAYNVAFYKNRDRRMYEQALRHLIEETKQGRMFGEWNDYGRLL